MQIIAPCVVSDDSEQKVSLKSCFQMRQLNEIIISLYIIKKFLEETHK
jgi:hypothetical protein